CRDRSRHHLLLGFAGTWSPGRDTLVRRSLGDRIRCRLLWPITTFTGKPFHSKTREPLSESQFWSSKPIDDHNPQTGSAPIHDPRSPDLPRSTLRAVHA